MKLFIFAIFALIILQTTMAMPVRNGEEEVEIDPAKLHKAIKNLGKFQKALKQIEAKYQAQEWEDAIPQQKAIHKKSWGSDIETIAKGGVKLFDILENLF
uniref:Uncharacterized protein n=1 Tax=Panagrolaimus sp. ES5 TaxID=591445 RepID=A0AC34G579_9BILA